MPPIYNDGVLSTGAIASGGITAASIATDAIGAAEVAGDAGIPTTTLKTVTFTGAAGAGAVGSVSLYTVTGEVLVVALVCICDTDLTEALATATVALGVTSSTALFIAATNSTLIDAGEFWVSTTPTANGIALPAAMKDIVITDDIIITCGAQNTNGGVLRFQLLWMPLSANGAVVAV